LVRDPLERRARDVSAIRAARQSGERAARLGGEGARWIEIGPGAVLAGLLRRIVPGASVVSLGSAPQVEQFLEAA